MFHNMSISKKIHLPLIFSIAVGLLIIFVNYLMSVNEIREDVYVKEEKTFDLFVKKAFHSKENIGITNAINISKNHSVVIALRDNNRAVAIKGLKTLATDFKNGTKFKNVKIHIHDRNVHSFLRAWKPTKHGDDLKGFRKTIVHVNRLHSLLSLLNLDVLVWLCVGWPLSLKMVSI